MKAFRVLKQGVAEIVEVPVPKPGPFEVLVKVKGCGLCHSDIGFMNYYTAETMPGGPPPFTLGHETAGQVAAIGEGVINLQIGDGVCIYALWGSCGQCHHCRLGEENLCAYTPGPVGCGVGRDGGLAEYVLVPQERFAIPLRGVDPATAGILSCAGTTAYAAIDNIRSLIPEMVVAVVGSGGLGMMAIQILRATKDAIIIALDINSSRLDIAREMGADDCLVYDNSAAAKLRKMTGDAGVDVVIDCVGNDETMNHFVKALRRGGDFILVGAGRGTLPFTLHQIPVGAHFSTVMNGGTRHLRELITLVELGCIRLHTDIYPLSKVTEAYEAMNNGTLSGRAVCIPD